MVLRRLAVFASAFNLEAACAVVASAEFAPSEVVEGIAGLATKSLVAAEVDGTIATHRRMAGRLRTSNRRSPRGARLGLLAARERLGGGGAHRCGGAPLVSIFIDGRMPWMGRTGPRRP